MFFKLHKCLTIFKKHFLTETEMQILTEIQIQRDLTLRHTFSHISIDSGFLSRLLRHLSYQSMPPLDIVPFSSCKPKYFPPSFEYD